MHTWPTIDFLSVLYITFTYLTFYFSSIEKLVLCHTIEGIVKILMMTTIKGIKDVKDYQRSCRIQLNKRTLNIDRYILSLTCHLIYKYTPSHIGL